MARTCRDCSRTAPFKGRPRIITTANPGQRARADNDGSSIQSRLALILGGSDFPALSQQIIETISALDDDASSLQRLANVVLREYSLTLSVVRTANSAHYRRTGRPIQSATHAMMMLGARTVRHLASSLLLFENYSRRSPKLKELMLLSLLTANQARDIATRLGVGDPEEAHLCGMFRNLGEVLVACHFPEEYDAIQIAMEARKLTAAGAANSVLGFRYEELGIALAKHWGMPNSVLTGMSARALSPLTELGGIVSFSHDLTRAIYRANEHKGDSQHAVDEVLALYAPRLKLTRVNTVEIVESALAETRELFGAATVHDGAALRTLTSAAREALGERLLNTGEWDAASLAASAADALLALREKLRQELETKADPASQTTLGNVLLLALEAAMRGGPFDRAIVCVLNADRTQLTARAALGVGAEALLPKFDFPMSARGGPVPAALLQRHPVYLPVDRSLTESEGRWAAGMECAQFGVFPIIVALKLVGCIYVDRAAPHALPDRPTIAYVKSLCGLVAAGIGARRGGKISGEHPENLPAQAAATRRFPAIGAVTNDNHSTESDTSRGVDPQVPMTWAASLEASISTRSELTAESKAAIVLRVLQGADGSVLARAAGVTIEQIDAWKNDFLAGALSRMD
ncbi:MAG: HDOD domain-containing protein [Gemmatimonadaceae bacterium]